MRISNLLLGILATASTTLGCYRHGLKFSKIGGNVENCIEDFCKSVGFEFKAHEDKGKCCNFGWARVNMGLKNEQKTAQGMSTEECKYVFLKDYRECPKGSYQVRNGFRYWIDPNRGKCR